MQIIKGKYTDFELFKNDVRDWDLNFNILSKQDFYASFKMVISEDFLLSREVLNGKIEHSGLSPIGFKTLVIPVEYNNSEFVWYNKKSQSKEMLLFPKNNIIDVVTFNGLDLFFLSIRETRLMEAINKLGFLNCKDFFNSDEVSIKIDSKFTIYFNQLANTILNSANQNTEYSYSVLNNIVYLILKQIENSKPVYRQKQKVKKEIALRKAIEIINEKQDVLYSVQDLCGLVGVSEKTLFTAFKEKYKVSPSEYLKSLRLNKVKHEIENIKHKDINISTIAGKYHFWHMGQFAKDFRKHFGILPSEV